MAAEAPGFAGSKGEAGRTPGAGRRDTDGYLYLLVNPTAPAGVLKVGRTNDLTRRLSQYPRGSRYLEVFGPVEDCHSAERHLISAMRSRFLSSERGREYFHGGAEEVNEHFHGFCYSRLQEDHMPWMPVPMDVDGGRGAGGRARVK